ncbi:uncharacterized protein LOC107627458 [Arachis ipaensis]|uniref:uncharacterized protein LOC107627458 n=1 Tax=Arachis ipaensis TaxID=130454 RepID=UPI0007AF3274|nr:uncharacterized protein LOC107627458 [Arachis ipaensis]XP_025636120.1 uncharacterized protein LOC112730237 [Arachis hypogaea]
MEYCEYHKIYGHSTNDCYDLKNIIEKLARESRLERYLVERSDDQGKRKKKEEEDRSQRDQPTRTPDKHIHMIVGGFVGCGVTKSSCKRHLKGVYQVEEKDEVPELPIISFTKEDAQEITLGHDDPVVVTMILANTNLHRTLVDQGSSADILFTPALDKLELEENELRAYPDTLYGLGDTPIQPLGFIPLHTTFGKGMKSRTLSIDYIVVNVALAYNALIGRTTLNRLAIIVSTPHLCMKFPISKGITPIRGDQKLARRCNNENLNLCGCTKGKEINTIELRGVQTREKLRPQPD